MSRHEANWCGGTVRHIIANAVLSVLKEDIQEAAGSSQLCAGQLSGCEVAVHSVQTLFGSPDTEAAMLVDATNAFNSLNHQATLRITFCTFVHYSPLS